MKAIFLVAPDGNKGRHSSLDENHWLPQKPMGLSFTIRWGKLANIGEKLVDYDITIVNSNHLATFEADYCSPVCSDCYVP